MKYGLKGNRKGFDIPDDAEVRETPDGYTEVWKRGRMIGVYQTALLAR